MFHRLTATALAVTALLGLAGVGAAADGPADLATALAMAADQDKVVVIDFFTDW